MTKVIIKMLSSWYVLGRPTDRATSEGLNPSDCNTIKRGSSIKHNSWNIEGKKMKGF